MRNRRSHILIAAILLTCGVLVSVTIDRGTSDDVTAPASQSALDSPRFSVRYRGSQLSISGTSASSGHEDGLQQLIAYQFGDAEVESKMSAAVLLPDRWETTSMRLLYALAATDSAQAEMSAAGIDIRGVTTNPKTLESRVNFLRESIAPDAVIRQDIVVVDATYSLATLCRRNLAYAANQPVAFRQSSAELRPSSFAVLDRLVGLANDCRGSEIAITGHSDASGNETWNRQLSLARAQSVADYFVANGVPANQLIVAGAGSSEPIADNETAHGRGLNRRIEFDLR